MSNFSNYGVPPPPPPPPRYQRGGGQHQGHQAQAQQLYPQNRYPHQHQEQQPIQNGNQFNYQQQYQVQQSLSVYQGQAQTYPQQQQQYYQSDQASYANYQQSQPQQNQYHPSFNHQINNSLHYQQQPQQQWGHPPQPQPSHPSAHDGYSLQYQSPQQQQPYHGKQSRIGNSTQRMQGHNRGGRYQAGSNKPDRPRQQAEQPKKKVNSKMEKKYSGRGFKTITISGHGIKPRKFKVCVGNDPADIAKWIEERRKRFPRSGHVKRDGNCSTENVDSPPKAVSGRGDQRGYEVETKKRSGGDDEVDDSNETSSSKRICIKGEDGDGEQDGLSSLLAGYDSSSSKDEGDDPAKPGSAVKAEIVKDRQVDDSLETGGTAHKQAKGIEDKNDPELAKQKKREAQSANDRARSNYEQELQMLGLITPNHGSRYTTGESVINSTSLLHRLLERDKERERRLTLQLLRYLVDSDYLEGREASKSG